MKPSFIDNLSHMWSFLLVSQDRGLVMSSNFDCVQSWAQQNVLISGLNIRWWGIFTPIFREDLYFDFDSYSFQLGGKKEQNRESSGYWRRLSRLEPPKFPSEMVDFLGNHWFCRAVRSPVSRHAFTLVPISGKEKDTRPPWWWAMLLRRRCEEN